MVLSGKGIKFLMARIYSLNFTFLAIIGFIIVVKPCPALYFAHLASILPISEKCKIGKIKKGEFLHRNLILMPGSQKVFQIGRLRCFVRVMPYSLMPHTNVLSLRKDHMTMYYISYSMYWIYCTVLFYWIFSTKALLKYTRVANAERFCPFVRQCWTHSVFLLRRKWK